MEDLQRLIARNERAAEGLGEFTDSSAPAVRPSLLIASTEIDPNTVITLSLKGSPHAPSGLEYVCHVVNSEGVRALGEYTFNLVDALVAYEARVQKYKAIRAWKGGAEE